jgi:hypothetical protein
VSTDGFPHPFVSDPLFEDSTVPEEPGGAAGEGVQGGSGGGEGYKLNGGWKEMRKAGRKYNTCNFVTADVQVCVGKGWVRDRVVGA